MQNSGRVLNDISPPLSPEKSHNNRNASSTPLSSCRRSSCTPSFFLPSIDSDDTPPPLPAARRNSNAVSPPLSATSSNYDDTLPPLPSPRNINYDTPPPPLPSPRSINYDAPPPPLPAARKNSSAVSLPLSERNNYDTPSVRLPSGNDQLNNSNALSETITDACNGDENCEYESYGVSSATHSYVENSTLPQHKVGRIRCYN